MLIIRRTFFYCYGVFVSTKDEEREREEERRREGGGRDCQRKVLLRRRKGMGKGREKKTNRQHATICQSSFKTKNEIFVNEKEKSRKEMHDQSKRVVKVSTVIFGVVRLMDDLH